LKKKWRRPAFREFPRSIQIYLYLKLHNVTTENDAPYSLCPLQHGKQIMQWNNAALPISLADICTRRELADKLVVDNKALDLVIVTL